MIIASVACNLLHVKASIIVSENMVPELPKQRLAIASNLRCAPVQARIKISLQRHRHRMNSMQTECTTCLKLGTLRYDPTCRVSQVGMPQNPLLLGPLQASEESVISFFLNLQNQSVAALADCSDMFLVDNHSVIVVPDWADHDAGLKWRRPIRKYKYVKMLLQHQVIM